MARKLLRRAVRHLEHAGSVDGARRAGARIEDARLIRQALERLAVADLLIEAYTTPPPGHPARERPPDEAAVGT